ncbi:MAG: AMP-binding protein [Blautia sp.]|nr:AMP-binding protein [Blautia sp.]
MELIQKTVGEFIPENAARYGDKTAMQAGDFVWSYRELDEITDALACRLVHRYGVRKGTHMGIWSVNTPAYVFLFLAAQKLGAVPIPLNTCYKPAELSPILVNMDVEILFYGEGWKDLVYSDLIPEIGKLAPEVREYVPMNTFGGSPFMGPGNFTEEERSDESRGEIRKMTAEVSAEDTACIVMTSGTTLSPKGVMLSHYNIVNDGRSAALYMHWTDEDKMLLELPMFHCFGLITGVVVCTMKGICMDIIPYFGTALVWEIIEKHGITILNGVPSVFLALVRKPEYKNTVSEKLKSGVIAGSRLRYEDYMEICRHFPNMHLQTSYGMTESSPSVTFPDWDEAPEKKAASCGKFMDRIEGRIVDPASGEILSVGMNGELQMKGFNITKGYYNMPEETARAFTEDGWLRTGDLARFDEEGNLYITGRLKELIIRAGENISVVEIESVIDDSGMAEASKVVGVDSSFRQEEIAALVVPTDPDTFDPEALKEYMKPRLAVYKIPDYIFTVNELPMTGSGKIDLKAAKELAEKRVKESMTSH